MPSFNIKLKYILKKSYFLKISQNYFTNSGRLERTSGGKLLCGWRRNNSALWKLFSIDLFRFPILTATHLEVGKTCLTQELFFLGGGVFEPDIISMVWDQEIVVVHTFTFHVHFDFGNLNPTDF